MKKYLLVAAALFIAAQVALSQTWVATNSGTNDWICVASSANGGKLIAGQNLGIRGVLSGWDKTAGGVGKY